jgi:hypothetical protein
MATFKEKKFLCNQSDPLALPWKKKKKKKPTLAYRHSQSIANQPTYLKNWKIKKLV